MPYIHVTTNLPVPEAAGEAIKRQLGHAVTALRGKSEDFLMVRLEDDAAEPAEQLPQTLVPPAGVCKIRRDGILGLERPQFLGRRCKKAACRLRTRLACRFPVRFYKNPRRSIKVCLGFLFHRRKTCRRDPDTFFVRCRPKAVKILPRA